MGLTKMREEPAVYISVLLRVGTGDPERRRNFYALFILAAMLVRAIVLSPATSALAVATIGLIKATVAIASALLTLLVTTKSSKATVLTALAWEPRIASAECRVLTLLWRRKSSLRVACSAVGGGSWTSWLPK